MTNDHLIYDENVCAFPHIWLCTRFHLNLPIYEENFVFFLSVYTSSLFTGSYQQWTYKAVGTFIVFTANALSRNSKQIFPVMKLRGLVPNFYILHDRSAKEKNRRTYRWNIKIAHRFKSMGYFYNGYLHRTFSTESTCKVNVFLRWLSLSWIYIHFGLSVRWKVTKCYSTLLSVSWMPLCNSLKIYTSTEYALKFYSRWRRQRKNSFRVGPIV